TFRKPDARAHITSAIASQISYVVIHKPTSTIAAIFALNSEDPFDQMLWGPLLGEDGWKDALYVHRLVVEKDFQGRGIVPKVLKFTEELVPQKGKNDLDHDDVDHDDVDQDDVDHVHRDMEIAPYVFVKVIQPEGRNSPLSTDPVIISPSKGSQTADATTQLSRRDSATFTPL
ncbi:hypothetical protein BGZ97_008503, partial [Linnemannia gamsii]